MTVGELKALLDDYGDHLPVGIGTDMNITWEFDVVPGTDHDGMSAVLLSLE